MNLSGLLAILNIFWLEAVAIIGSFASTFITRGMGAVGGMLLSLFVARIAGAEGLGSFAVFLSLLGVGSIFARRGKDMLLVRAVAWSLTQVEHKGVAIALLWHSIVRVFFPAFILGCFISGLLASGVFGKAFPKTIPYMPIMLFMMTVLFLVAGYIKGVSRASLSPLFGIGGISAITALILAAATFLEAIVQVEFVTTAFCMALTLLICIACMVIWVDRPESWHLYALNESHKEELHSGQIDFTFIALATFLTQAGSFLLAAPFLQETDLGLLRSAERLALLVSFPMLAINPVIMPHIVRLSRSANATALQRLMRIAIIVSGTASACVALPLLIWPEIALNFMGEEFIIATSYLRWMVCVQLLVAIFGPLAALLNMSGRERASMWINVGALILAIVAIPICSIVYGAPGFVLAYSVIIVARISSITFVVMRG